MLITRFILFLFNLVSVTLGVYNTEVYNIYPKTSRDLIRNYDIRFLFENVGLVTLEVQFKYGKGDRWVKYGEKRFMKPGETWVIDHPNCENCDWKSFEVVNSHKMKGLVHCLSVNIGYAEYDNLFSPNWDLDGKGLSQIMASTGVAHLPFHFNSLAERMDFFWPKNNDNIWNKFKEVLKGVSEKISKDADITIRNELLHFHYKLEKCAREVDGPNVTKAAASYYINIAEDLVDLESLFEESDVLLNFNEIPLYAATINFKLLFYQYGIKNKEKLGFDKKLEERLRHYIFQMIYSVGENAVDHIVKACEKKLEYVYTNVYSEILYNEMSGAREYCALGGLEYIPIWKLYAKDALAPQPTQIPILVYSNQYGRNSATQTFEILALESKTFSPKIINGKFNEISYIDVFLTHQEYIAGLEIHYKNEDVEFTGVKPTKSRVNVDFEVNLTAYGNGQINGLSFHFENGKSVLAGKKHENSYLFHLHCHYIVGLFGAVSYVRVYWEQIANIAVSYTLGLC